jgi:hypothetical protein
MKVRAILASAVLVGLVMFSAVSAGADPNLNNVPAHRHYITMDSGERVEVGPRVCDYPSLQGAFNQFHNNLHVSAGFGRAAPGLHNGQGGEIVPGPC